MKSFNKIALAMVAAMTLGTIVATPASAAVMSVVATVNSVDKASALAIATPAVLPVPSDNKIDATDALKFVATVDTGTSVSVTTTNATIVSALHTDAAPVGATSGSSSLTVATGTGTTATFYVYTKTTAIGTVVITNGGTTYTYYVQGQAGLINNLTVSAPATGASGTKQDILVTATDVFGNKVSGKSITATVFAATGTLDSATALTGATLADFGLATFKVTLPTIGTRTLVMFAPTSSGDAVSVAVVGLTAPTLAPFAEIAVRDLVAELKATQDALAAEKAARAIEKAASDKALADAKIAADAALAKAIADAKVVSDKALADAKIASDLAAATAKATYDMQIATYKARFNYLATKWNKKHPTQKVALLK